MKIAISGTQCIGKSTFVNDFLKKWPMYRTAGTDCTTVIKNNTVKHSQESTEETQDLILNHLVDQALSCSKTDHVLFDRCVLDNLAYTTWLCLKEKINPKYLEKVVPIIRETIKLYDIIFLLPITKVSPVNLVDNGTRDIDPVFREEIDNIFKAFCESYHKHDKKIFDPSDSPAIIEIFGKPEERIKMAEFYVNENGNMYGEDESLIHVPLEFNKELQEELYKY
jgi:hypothetical protein